MPSSNNDVNVNNKKEKGEWASHKLTMAEATANSKKLQTYRKITKKHPHAFIWLHMHATLSTLDFI